MADKRWEWGGVLGLLDRLFNKDRCGYCNLPGGIAIYRWEQGTLQFCSEWCWKNWCWTEAWKPLSGRTSR